MLIGPERLATARQPDGKILTAVPGDQVVYIDLGQKDTLTLGLQFTVYSAKTGIPPDGHGKARVEVVSISPESAECRIMYVRPGQVILEGDLVANPVYDPNRPLTFVVNGEFDLDRDGIVDRNGAATLESLIRDWGGRVSSEVTPLTDFVVLGTPPRRPRVSGDSGAAPAGMTSGTAPGKKDAWTGVPRNPRRGEEHVHPGVDPGCVSELPGLLRPPEPSVAGARWMPGAHHPLSNKSLRFDGPRIVRYTYKTGSSAILKT